MADDTGGPPATEAQAHPGSVLGMTPQEWDAFIENVKRASPEDRDRLARAAAQGVRSLIGLGKAQAVLVGTGDDPGLPPGLELARVLSGTAETPALDEAVMSAVHCGLSVEHLGPGRYRVEGPDDVRGRFASWVKKADGVQFLLEMPPLPTQISFHVLPVRPSLRHAYVHGTEDAGPMVARAVDAGLTVETIGLFRFKVTGQTRDHILWMQAYFKADRARVLQIMALTEAQAIAEDAAAPPVAVNVVLPPRVTTSDITRDRAGDITQIRQMETNA